MLIGPRKWLTHQGAPLFYRKQWTVYVPIHRVVLVSLYDWGATQWKGTYTGHSFYSMYKKVVPSGESTTSLVLSAFIITTHPFI